MRIILVHGANHGAWCWHKVVDELRSWGYSVFAVDLAACGSDPRTIPEDVSSFDEYSQPLMDVVAETPDEEKLILVGHSTGGLALASAMEAFPQKIAVAVFVSAIIPNTTFPPWKILKEHHRTSTDLYKDLKVEKVFVPGRSRPFSVMTLDAEFLERYVYQNCSPEDLALASMLVRPASLFKEDLETVAFSEETYGSVDKVFVVSGEDAVLGADFQRWMAEYGGVNEVMEIEDADHMPMLSKPQELCDCLLEVFSRYAD